MTNKQHFRVEEIERINKSILDHVRSEGFSDKEIEVLEPRELFGQVCIAAGVCTADNGQTLFDVAEQIIEANKVNT